MYKGAGKQNERGGAGKGGKGEGEDGWEDNVQYPNMYQHSNQSY